MRVFADNRREGKEIQIGRLLKIQNNVILFCGDIDVVAAEPNQLNRPGEGIWWRTRRRNADDSEKGGLHRPRGNLEGLQEVGPHSRGNNDCNQKHLHVLPPANILWRRSNPSHGPLNLVADAINL
ncbi:MAG: hypothetical protein WCC08_09240, partial [Terrimicrobiaceae bacterium]